MCESRVREGLDMGDKKKPVYLIDMDGTLYRGGTPIEFAREFIEYLQKGRRKFLLATNCPGNSAELLIQKLALMNIMVERDNILTSGQVTASYVSANKIASRVFLIGSKALEEELKNAGLQMVDEKPDCVIVGFDREFNYEKMKKAIGFINAGTRFIVTNGDYTIPEGEEIIPHTGAIAAGIEMATGVRPIVMGKPEKYMLSVAQEKLDCAKEECCIIGDRLDTDIAMGCNLDINSYLVMTGVTTYDLLDRSEFKPTKVFNNLNEIMMYEKD